MTVTKIYSPTRTTGNGSTDEFTADWQVTDETDVDVYLIDTGATTNKTLQTITTHYTVTINETTENATITFVTPPPSTKDVILERSIANTQVASIPDVATLRENQIEDPLDRNTKLIQQLEEKLGRSLKLSVADDTNLASFSGEVTNVTSNAVLSYNSDASAVTSTTLGALSAIGYPSSNGVAVATGSNTFISRSVESTSAGIMSVTNGDGVSGNISLDPTPLVDDLAATTSGNGASKIGLEDSAGNVTATTAEGAIAELAANTFRAVQQVSTTRASTTASGSSTLAHSLGKEPSSIQCVANNPTGTAEASVGFCTTDGTSFAQACHSDDDSGAGGQHIQKAFIAQVASGSEANYQRAAISAVNASSFTVTFTKGGTPNSGTYEFEFVLGA